MPATKEKSREASVVDAGSDSDDSVIHVPFVKPQPPVVVLDVSDNDDEPTRPVGSKVAENVASKAPENNVPPPESPVRGVGWAISTRPGSNVEEYQNNSVATGQSPKKKKKKDKKRKESTESSSESKRLKQAEGARLLVEVQKKKKEERRLAKQAKRERKKNNASLASTSPSKTNPVEGSKNNPAEGPKKKQRKRKKELESPGSAPDKAVAQIAPDTTESISQSAVDPPETPQTLFETTLSNSKKKPRSKSTSGTDSPTTAEPKRKRTKRKALTAAEKDHLNFLKTLNLTGNIGFDENDMLNMALSPADFIRPPSDKRTQRLAGRVPDDAHDSDTSNTTISTDIDPREINRAVPSQVSSPAEVPGPSRPPDSTPNFNIARSTQTAFVTVTHEKDKRSRKKQSKQKSSSSNTLLAAANIVLPATVPEKPSTTTTTRNDDDKQTSSQLETQTTRPASHTPQTVEVVSVTTEQSKSPTKRKTDSCTKTGEVAADEDEGVFTHQELNELQSNIRLNITGATTSHNPSPSDSHASNINISKDSRTPGSKKTLRYFSVRAEDTEEGRIQSKDWGLVEGKNKKRKRDASSPRRAEKSKKVRVFKIISDQAQATVPHLDLARDDAAAVREAENSQGLGYRAFPDTWSDEMKSFYGAVRGSSLDVRQVVSKQDPSPHLWRIPKDLERERKKKEWRRRKCNNCNRFADHVAKNCPEPRRKFVCLMCGVEGHTTECMYDDRNCPRNMSRRVITRCRETMCLTCGRKNHPAKNAFLQACNACQKGDKNRCDCCGQTTHLSAECPDNWRRFHSTTVDYDDEDLQRKVKNNELREELQKTVYRSQCEMYCSNCARKGHSYYHCLATKDLNTPYVTVKPYIVQELPASVRNYRADMVEPGSPSDVIVVSDVESNSAERQEEQVASKRTRSKSDDRLKERKKSAGHRMSKDANSSTSQINDNSNVPTSTAGICERQSGESVQESLAPSVVNPSVDKPADAGVMSSEDTTRSSSTEKTVENSMTACATEDVNVTSGESEGINRPAESKKTEKVPEELNQVIELSSPEVIPLEDSDIEIIEVPESPRSSTDQRAASREKSPKKKAKVLLSGKCVDYPDCSNSVPSSGPPCFRLELTKREHTLLVAFKRRFKIIQKLNAYYARQKLSIDLCEKKKEFHIGGSQYYYARERLVRLVREIKDEKNVYKLLPELFASEAARKDSVNESVVSSTTEASTSVEKPSDKEEIRTDGEVVAENTEEVNEIEKEGVEAAAQDAVTSHLRPSEKIVEEVANSSTASPLFSRYDFEKKLRRIAVQVAKPSETVTSSEIPSSPQSPTSTSPSTTVEQMDSLEVAEKNSTTQDNIPHEISNNPVNAQSSSSKSQQPSQVGRSRAVKPTDDTRSQHKPFAEDDWDEQPRGGDQSHSNRYERERDHRSRGRNFRGYNSRPSRGRHSRERRRFSPGYPPRGPPPSRPYNNVGYGPSYPPPHDIDERIMPAGARDMPNPFDSPNSPFSNQWMWIPFGMDPRHGYQPQNYPNDLHVPVNTPDGFAMDRQYFTGPYGTPLYNPDAPMPRPRFPN